MIQRLHLAYSPSRRCFALVISPHRVRLWMMPEIEPEQLGHTEMSSGHDLELETQGAGIVGVEFIDDHTLLCVHHDGVMQGWALDVNPSSNVLLNTPLHGDFERLPEPPHEDELESVPDINRALPQENPLAGASSLPRPHVMFTRSASKEHVVQGHGLSAELLWRFELGMRLESCVFWHEFEHWDDVRVAMGTPTGQIVRAQITPHDKPQTYTLNGHGGAVSMLSFSGDGTMLASSSRKRDICIWRADSTSLIQAPWRVLTGSEGEVWSLTFSPSGRYLVSGGIDNSVYYWDILAKRPLRAVSKDHEGWIADLAWSHDERVVASASWDNTVGLFRNGDMAPLYCFDFHEDYVVQVLFVPNSNYLISAGYDQKIAVWDWRNAQLVTRLDSHNDWVQRLCWIGNGMMASASSDKQVRLWSLETLTCQYVLTQRSEEDSEAQAIQELSPHQPLVHREGFGAHRISHLGSTDSLARARAAVESAGYEPLGEVSVFVDDAPSSIPFKLETEHQDAALSSPAALLAQAPEQLEPLVEEGSSEDSEPNMLSEISEQRFSEVDAAQAPILGDLESSEVFVVPTSERSERISVPDDAWALLESSLYDEIAPVDSTPEKESLELSSASEDLSSPQEDISIEQVELDSIRSPADSLVSSDASDSESSEGSAHQLDELVPPSDGTDVEHRSEAADVGQGTLVGYSLLNSPDGTGVEHQPGAADVGLGTLIGYPLLTSPDGVGVKGESSPVTHEASEVDGDLSESSEDAHAADVELEAQNGQDSSSTHESVDASIEGELSEEDVVEEVPGLAKEPFVEGTSEEAFVSEDMLKIHDAESPANAWSDTLYNSGESEPSGDVSNEVKFIHIESVESHEQDSPSSTAPHLLNSPTELANESSDSIHGFDVSSWTGEEISAPSAVPSQLSDLDSSASSMVDMDETSFAERAQDDREESIVESSFSALEETGKQSAVSMPSSDASLPDDVSFELVAESHQDTAHPVYFGAPYTDNAGTDSFDDAGHVPMQRSVLNPRSSGFLMLDEFSSPEMLSEEPSPRVSRPEPVGRVWESSDVHDSEVQQDNSAPQHDLAPQYDVSSSPEVRSDSFDDLSLGMFDGVISDVVPDPSEPSAAENSIEFSRDAVKSAFWRQRKDEVPIGSPDSSGHPFPGMALSKDQKEHVPGSWSEVGHEPEPEPEEPVLDASQTIFGFKGLVRSGLVQEQVSLSEGIEDDSEPAFVLQDEFDASWSVPEPSEAQSISEQSAGSEFDRASTVANASPASFLQGVSSPSSAPGRVGSSVDEELEERLSKDTSEFFSVDSQVSLRVPKLHASKHTQLGAPRFSKSLEENTRPGEISHEQEMFGDTSAFSGRDIAKQTMGFGSPMASGLIDHLKAQAEIKPLPEDTCKTFELTFSEVWQMRLAERKPAMQIFKRRRVSGTYRNQECLNGHHDEINEVIYCEQGKFFAVIGNEPVVEIWSPRRGRLGCLSTPEPIEHINVTSDGRVLVAGCASGALHVWLLPKSIKALGDMSIGKVVLMGSSRVKSVSFDIHGRYMMAGFLDGNTILWDMIDGHEHVRLLHHSGGVLSTSFDNNGPITACEDNILRFWSMDSQVQGLIGGVGQLIVLKADTRGLYGLSVNGLLHHYQGNEHHETYTFDQHPVDFDLSTDGVLVVAGNRGELTIYPKGLSAPPQVIDLGQDLTSVAVAGPLIVVGTKDGGLEILKRQ